MILEEPMEEYEVDLRDYLRVLWRGKWIVLATFLAAVGVAALVSFRAPDVFRAEAVLSWEVPPGAPTNYSAPSIDSLLQRVRDPSFLSRAAALVEANPPSAAWLAGHLAAKKEGRFLELVLEAPLAPDTLQEYLSGVVSALDEELKSEVIQAVEERLSSLATRREELQGELARWESQLAQARTRAQDQRATLLEKIGEIESHPELLSLNLGDAVTVRGYLVQEELDLLYRRLQEVELALDEMDRLGVLALPGVGGKIGAIEGELVSLEVEEAALKELLCDPPAPLTLIRGPAASATPVGPNRKMNLAVAGVLGLFCGVLLAFFWHWLRKPPVEKGPSKGN